MAERAKAADMPILKIKLGISDDVAIVSAIRQVFTGCLRVDANAAGAGNKRLLSSTPGTV